MAATVMMSGIGSLVAVLPPAVAPRPVLMAAMATAGVAGGALSAVVVTLAGRASPPQRARALTSVAAAALAAPVVVSLVTVTVATAGGSQRAVAPVLGTGVAVLAVGLAPALRGLPRPPSLEPDGPRRRQAPFVLPSVRTVGVIVGASASNYTALLLVPLLMDAGLSGAVAGGVGTIAAGLALALRVVIAASSDRFRRVTRTALPLLAVGGASCVLLAYAPTPIAAVAAIGVAVGSWTWTGLALASTHAAADPDRAGVHVQRGVLIGAAGAPLLATARIGGNGPLIASAAALWVAAALLAGPLRTADRRSVQANQPRQREPHDA